MAAQPFGVSTTPDYVSSTKLQRVHSVPESRTLMKNLNNGTPLLTGLTLELVILITIF